MNTTSVLPYKKTIIACACGNTLEVGSTVEDIRVEICSACHPFFTGKTKLVDTAHRVHRFEKLRQKAEAVKTTRRKKTTKKKSVRKTPPAPKKN